VISILVRPPVNRATQDSPPDGESEGRVDGDRSCMTSLLRLGTSLVLLLLALPACRGDSTSPRAVRPDLQARLLAVADLPAGWATDASTPAGTSSEPACLYQSQADPHSMEAVQTRLVGGTYLPTFAEWLNYFGRASAASAALTRASDALTACGRLAFRRGTTSYTGGFRPVLIAGLGSDARAWRLGLRGSDGSVIGVYLVLARHEATVLFAIVADARQPVRPALLALPAMAYLKIT
jgi:hypothetical protein